MWRGGMQGTDAWREMGGEEKRGLNILLFYQTPHTCLSIWASQSSHSSSSAARAIVRLNPCCSLMVLKRADNKQELLLFIKVEPAARGLHQNLQQGNQSTTPSSQYGFQLQLHPIFFTRTGQIKVGGGMWDEGGGWGEERVVRVGRGHRERNKWMESPAWMQLVCAAAARCPASLRPFTGPRGQGEWAPSASRCFSLQLY